MGNDMFNDEQLAHAEIVQKETEDALGFWKDRALKAEAKLADKYLIEEQYEAACGDRDGLLRMVETLREQKNALLAEATRTSLRYLTERDDWFAAYQRTEALRLEAVQGMVAAERELGEARAEVSPQATTDAGMTLAECIRHQRQLLEEKTCQHAEALSRARETDGASSTLVPERPGESPSRCGLAFGQCRYQRRAAAKSCALLNTPTPELDMTHVLFPGSRPKPNPKTEDGAVREAAERLNATGEEMARLDENNFADSFAALHVLAPRFIREAKALLSALSSPPRPGAEAPITCEEVGCPTCCPSPRPATKAPTFTHWSGSATKPDAPPAEAAREAARVRICACAWCGAALVQDPDALHRWRCINAEQRKCVARGDWYVLDDDRDYVPAYPSSTPAPAPSAKETKSCINCGGNQTCERCGGSGGGPDLPHRCISCDGTGRCYLCAPAPSAPAMRRCEVKP